MMDARQAKSRATRLRELDERLRARIPDLRTVEFDIGRLLLEIRRLGDFTVVGSTTFPIYCESVGLSATEGREFTAMVEAAAVRPEVETEVLAAKLTPQKATVIHEIQKRPELRKRGEDLLALAESKCGRELLEDLKKRRDEARIGGPPVSRILHFTSEEARDLDRTREIVSRGAGHMVSEGEAAGRACRVFLELHDPEEEARRMKEKDEKARAALAGASAVGASEARPRRAMGIEDLERSRHIAALTRREILRVAGDRCWVENCPNRVFLECCHRRPFRAGGANALWNLLHLCHDHHGGFDLGRWWPLRRSDGAWILMSKEGRNVGFLREPVGRFLDRFEPGLAAQGRAPP